MAALVWRQSHFTNDSTNVFKRQLCAVTVCNLAIMVDAKPMEYKGEESLTHLVKERRKYQCELCPATCWEATKLLQHLEAVHFNFREWKCEKCDYLAKYKHNLKRHIEDVYEKIREHKCPL
jgi:hypothetical protein